jgi:uncharacterized protein YegP (UPF0339 family)
MFRILCVASLAIGLSGLSSAAARPDEKLKFELYKDKAGEFRWRLKEGDTTLATGGQGYKAKADAKNGIASVQKSATDDKMKYEVYEDDKKDHRWRLKASNGQVIASSSGSYKTEAEAEKAVATVKGGVAKAEIVEIKD